MENANAPQPGQTAEGSYQYNYTYLEPIAMLDTLPPSENFSDPWLVLTGVQAIKLAINTLLSNQGLQGQAVAESEVREFIGNILWRTLHEEGKTFLDRLNKTFVGMLPQILSGKIPPDPAASSSPAAPNRENLCPYHMGFHSVGDRSAGRICPGKDIALDMLIDVLIATGNVRRGQP